MDNFQQILQLVVILFLLSMVCERISDFLKHYLSSKHLLGFKNKFMKVGDTITKFHKDDVKEKKRVFRILKINVFSGFALALILKADLLKIFNNIAEPGKTLGWNNTSDYEVFDYILLPFGIILTGLFISFGSKFWHDLLDLLYQIKNAKRVISDQNTYKIDNTEDLKSVFNTYQSDFIKAAYLEAKTFYLAKDNVKAIGIKSNEQGYYFELTVNQNDPSLKEDYQYSMADGTVHNIPIELIILGEGEKIMAHRIDLSSKVFDINNQNDWGTFGVLVNPLNSNSNKTYLLTCCHNVTNPLNEITEYDSSYKQAGTISSNKVIKIGNIVKAKRDFQIDAALIEVDPKKIKNYIPDNGTPGKCRKLLDSDRNSLEVYLYGARSRSKSGIITSLYCDPKITYSKNDEFTITDTIAISNNGKSISQPGDSGACVVDGSRKVIGLVVAGSTTTTYVMPIQTLLTKLNVQLV